jgi:hypothetical protein
MGMSPIIPTLCFLFIGGIFIIGGKNMNRVYELSDDDFKKLIKGSTSYL